MELLTVKAPLKLYLSTVLEYILLVTFHHLTADVSYV